MTLPAGAARRLSAALAVLALALTAAPAAAQPRPEPWPRWTAHDATATRVVDHSAWERWLAAYVIAGRDGVNRVAYQAVTGADRTALEGYIAGLSTEPVSGLNRPEQMAFWINLYNALTVQVVLDHYPAASILWITISPGWFSLGPWGKKLVRVAGEALSLDDIEHRILRPVWRDARIHYAVNCASIGCPNLARRAYRGRNMEAMLDAAARAYVNHRRGAAFEADGLHVSSLYKWYAEDFGASEAAVIAHLRRYARPALARRLAGVARIAGYRYDWDLNQAEKPR